MMIQRVWKLLWNKIDYDQLEKIKTDCDLQATQKDITNICNITLVCISNPIIFDNTQYEIFQEYDITTKITKYYLQLTTREAGSQLCNHYNTEYYINSIDEAKQEAQQHYQGIIDKLIIN